MSETVHQAAEEAICQVIADGGVAEFADVVNEVQRRFHLDVTSAQVEQVYHRLVEKQAQLEDRPSARIDLQMTSRIPKEATLQRETAGDAEPKLDDLSLALRFVKSVGGIKSARRLLDEIESTLNG